MPQPKSLDEKVDCLTRSFNDFMRDEHRPLKKTVDRLNTVLMAPDKDNEFHRQGVLVTIMAGCAIVKTFVKIWLPILGAAAVTILFIANHWKI